VVLDLISTGWRSANEYIKSHSGKVADVMTRNVVTAKPDTPLGEIAGLLERNRIKRAPIVEGGKLVGIVSRANILQALASAAKKLPSLASVDDLELRKNVVSRMASEPWRPTMLTVTVQGRDRRFVGPCPLGRGKESGPTRCRNHPWRARGR
jgi:signal-transduction protein with cAMP-binding, CBS, and nucleotidyltransferase domain